MKNKTIGYLSDTAVRIATDRYFTEEEKRLLPDIAFVHACDRIAKAVSLAEKEELQNQWRQEFYKVIVNKKLVPAGRFWANAGQTNQQFPNCFVFPIKDTKVNHKDGIFDTLATAVVTASGGGGTGFDFSRLRSRGIKTTKSRGVASGPISFIKSYDAVMENIQQGGSRRAANMGVLRVDHPDILEFIFLKDRSQKYRRFNVSVAMTDKFMKQLGESPDDPWVVIDPHTKQQYYIFMPLDAELIDNSRLEEAYPVHDYLKTNYLRRELHDSIKSPIEGVYITPRDIWYAIILNAWECGDPGLFFIDTANRANPLIDHYQDYNSEYYIHATNPCGEIPMEDNSICMLSAINLATFVIDKGEESIIDFKELKRVTSIGVRFLDDALDVSDYPTDDNKKKALYTRRIGLGLMGWADLLIKMKIIYGSLESIELARTIMKTINTTALETSISLGAEKGNFPLFTVSKYNVDRTQLTKDNTFPLVKTLRNSYRTTIAPTGTSSLLVGVNESLEPVWQFVHLRKDETGEHTIEHYLYTEYVDNAIGVIGRMEKPLPPYFITTMEIPYNQHIKMQAAFQDYIDNAISKTINLPKEATREDVEGAYKLAYSMGCKGITCYRDGSKEIQVLNVITSSLAEPTLLHSVTREEGILSGLTWKVKTGEGTCYITINKNGSQHPVEVFIRVGKAGSNINAYSEALGRIVSLALQHKVDPNIITKQLIGISGDKVIFHSIGSHHKVLSVPDAVGKVLEDFQSKVNLLSYTFNEGEALKEEDRTPEEDSAIDLKGTDIVLCNECLQPIKEVRGCRTCGCGSTCDE
jgi:ribonucleoside-diphosphate reductase alpha chain